jgi:hypothetical protein
MGRTQPAGAQTETNDDMKTKTLILAMLTAGLPAVWLVAPAAARDEPKAAAKWTETLVPTDERCLNTGSNGYFILEPGYQLTFAGREGGQKMDLVVTVLDETKVVDGVETRILEERESANGNLVEVSRNFFAVGEKTGNLYYYGEEVDIYKQGKVVAHEGAWLSGVKGAKYGILVPGLVKVGDRYYSEKAPKVAMDRQENVSTDAVVETPAGKFEHCFKVKETTPLEAGTEYKFYAPGLGLVQDGSLKLVKHGFVKK